MSAPPSEQVLGVFGLSGPAVPLTGGQRTAWRVGRAVLKFSDLTAEAVQWQSDVLHTVDGATPFRVSPPRPAIDGRWVVSGWSAWRWEPGHHVAGQWPRIVEVGSHLHAAIAEVEPPEWLLTRKDIWAVADRVAWGESPTDDYVGVRHIAQLRDALRDVTGRRQLVHGDLTGNVLFHDDLPPLIIDLSPYLRPTAFASAVVVADALAFENAADDVVDLLANTPDGVQYLLRALIFRIIADHLNQRDRAAPDTGADPYLAPVDIALRLALGR